MFQLSFLFRASNPICVQPVTKVNLNENIGYVYIERIPLRLSNITDIPFPDILHAYFNALEGFQILAKQFGFFIIS